MNTHSDSRHGRYAAGCPSCQRQSDGRAHRPRLVVAPQSVVVDQFDDNGEVVFELEVAPTISAGIGRQGS